MKEANYDEFVPKSNASNLSEEDIKNIEEYDEREIKTIELFVDSVRKNPGQYLSNIGDEGFMNCIREVFQNSADEMARPNSPCNKAWVTYYEENHRVVIADNGRAIAPNMIIRVFTREHTSANFVKAKGQYSTGMHGVGSKCVNAVSKRFSVTSYRLGKAYHIDFHEGKPAPEYKMKPKEIPNTNNAQGLVVDFEPDMSIMKEITINCEQVLDLLAMLVPLYKIGTVVEFTGYKLNGKVIHEVLENRDGILEYLIRKTDTPMIKPIIFGFDDGTMKADIAMTYVSEPNKAYDVITFANMTPVNTMLSTPSRGFINGVETFFRNYMNKIYLANSKKKMEVINSDTTVGLIGAVSASHMNVRFSGQAKNVCKNEDLFAFTKQLTIDSLKRWSKENPEDLQKVCQFIKDVANIRYKIDKEKVSISKKYNNTLTGMPKSFTKAEDKNHLELFIVEGLSASASCETGRSTKFQAIYPIRGKLPNAMNTTKEKFLKNEEVSGMLTVLQSGYGKNFDIEKCPYDKIIILSDQDLDGYHIRTLVLKFLLLYCRPLVEAGRVYIGLSPLYIVDKGKRTVKYFIDKMEFIRYVRDQFCKSTTILHEKNKKQFTKDEIQKLIYSNDNYDALLNTIASNFSVDPILLEDIVILRNKPFNDIKKCIQGKYKDMRVRKENNLVVMEGIIRDLYQIVVLNPQFVEAFSPLIPFIDRSEKRYIMNGNKVGLYEIINSFRESEPKNIERAKGLGELNSSELGESTLNPTNRRLLRYTCEDIEKEIEEMRRLDSDKFNLIKDIDISVYQF